MILVKAGTGNIGKSLYRRSVLGTVILRVIAQDRMQRGRPCWLVFSSLGVKKLESLVNRTLNIRLLHGALWFFSDHEADINRLADLVSVMANCFSKQTFQPVSPSSRASPQNIMTVPQEY
jgi:hypothetical protein